MRAQADFASTIVNKATGARIYHQPYLKPTERIIRRASTRRDARVLDLTHENTRGKTHQGCGEAWGPGGGGKWGLGVGTSQVWATWHVAAWCHDRYGAERGV